MNLNTDTVVVAAQPHATKRNSIRGKARRRRRNRQSSTAMNMIAIVFHAVLVVVLVAEGAIDTSDTREASRSKATANTEALASASRSALTTAALTSKVNKTATLLRRRVPNDNSNRGNSEQGRRDDATEPMAETEAKATTNTAASTNAKIQRLDLHPTSSLGRRRLSEAAPGDDATPHAEEWFHPDVNAVYATLHHDNHDDPVYHDFKAHRHLSRYERHARTNAGRQLLPNWDGEYDDQHFQLMDLPGSVDADGDSYFAPASLYERSEEKAEDANEDDDYTVPNNSSATFSRNLAAVNTAAPLYGGQFNNYQAVPLSQGYGTHYANIWVGTPTPQRKTVIVDTGSHFTAFPCVGCKNCGAEHHTDPFFDPSKSQSFHALQCNECLSTPTMTCHATKTNNRCHFSQAYTEGSSWQAYQARDIVYSGGPDILEAAHPIDTSMAIPFLFGCLQAENGLFVTQLADGIMGMSAHETTLVKQLYNANKLEHNAFGMCFRRELGTSRRGVTAGSMTLGGVATSGDTSPMVYAKNVRPYGWYTVHMKGMFLAPNGGMSFRFATDQSTKGIVKVPMDVAQVNSGKGVIVDSGTTDTYLNKAAAGPFFKLWKQVTGMEYRNGSVHLTPEQLRQLPTILIQCQAYDARPRPEEHDIGVGHVGKLDPSSPRDLLIAIPSTHYMEYSPALKLYTSRIYFTETQGGVLGANAMQGHNVLFDWENGRIGFAESSCEHDVSPIKSERTTSSSSSASGDAFDRSCSLASVPILTGACLDSVDVRTCHENDDPSNVALVGTEIWTRIVEAPGIDPSRCPAAANEWAHRSGTLVHDAPTVSCSGAGECEERRPCEISCYDAMRMEKERRKNSERRRMKEEDKVAVQEDKDVRNRIDGDEEKDGNRSKKERAKTDGMSSKKKNGLEKGDDFRNLDSSGICGDSFWSACDYSCQQTRIVSYPSSSKIHHSPSGAIGYKNGEDVCVEQSRETRECHIDACGREDPCRVPYLAHVNIALAGASPDDDWDKGMLDVFSRALAETAHDTQHKFASKRQLFHAGDVTILSVRPWYGDADEDRQMEGGSPDGASGLRVVFRVAVFNPNAEPTKPWVDPEMTPVEPPPPGGPSQRRQLLREITEIVRNITAPLIRKKSQMSTCNMADLYPLAKDAIEINGIFEHKDFVPALVRRIEKLESATKRDASPFHLVYSSQTNIKASKLISSWTIGTQVYEEDINYLGPIATAPYVFLIRILYEASLIFLFISLLSYLLPYVSKWTAPMEIHVMEWIRRNCSALRSQKKYDLVSLDDSMEVVQHPDETDTGDRCAIVGVRYRASKDMDVEMTATTTTKTAASTTTTKTTLSSSSTVSSSS